jgi:ribosome-binding protein aMBF1 (putative translation factor)
MNKYTFRSYLKKESKRPGFKKGFETEKRKLRIGYQIFLARKRAGMTQAELAKRMGTRQSNISRLEQGNYNFTVQMLEKIARALHFRLKIELIAVPLYKAA